MKTKLICLSALAAIVMASAPSSDFLGRSEFSVPDVNSYLGINSKDLLGIRNSTTTTQTAATTTTKTAQTSTTTTKTGEE